MPDQESAGAPLRHKDRLRLLTLTDAFQAVGVPLHRDQLMTLVSEMRPGLFSNASQLSAFLNKHPEAFPSYGDGVHFSQFAELSAKARDSADYRAFLALGRCAWTLLGDAARAELSYGRALELCITDSEGHRGLADVFIAQAKWNEASGVLRWLHWKHPEDRKTLTRLAFCAEKVSDWNTAVGYWSLLAERYPRDPGVLLRLGVAAFEDDDAELCAEALQAALAIDDEIALAHVLLARLAFEGDAPEEAFEHLQRGLELDPASVAEQCPGPLVDAFLDWSQDREVWVAELERYMRFR